MSVPNYRSESYKAKKFFWMRFRVLVRLQLKAFPVLEALVVRVYRAGRLLSYRCKWRVSAAMNASTKDIDVDKTYWVSPERISYCSLREFGVRDFKGHVVAGDWDLLEKSFDDLDVYIALKQVCLQGKDWFGTAFYQRTLDKLGKGQVLYNCTVKDDLIRRCKELERLFQKIRQEGYRTQQELLQEQQIDDKMQAEEEVTISIGRSGDLLFSDGAHRLAVAKLLGIPSIPVKVAVRHPQWIEFRKELSLYAHGEGGHTYQPATHPDLSDIPAFHDCDDRFSMMKRNLSVKRGNLLDIGANLGYFCHRFEDEEFDCYAVEVSELPLYFLRRLKRAEDKRFVVIAESVLDCRMIVDTPFNIVLALNIFHHFLKTKESYEKFLCLLGHLQTDVLFFEPHLPDELGMQEGYRNYSPSDFVDFLLSNTTLTKAAIIGTAEDGRSLYRLER